MMSRLSLLFLVIIVLVGVASIANYMYANVFERRREIGTLMALGATSSTVLRMFLLKALLLGLAGGIVGYLIGTILSVTLGPADAHARPVGYWRIHSYSVGSQLFSRAACSRS
jgi:putative ABC transport system permease protein